MTETDRIKRPVAPVISACGLSRVSKTPKFWSGVIRVVVVGRQMSKQALSAFERDFHGVWYCFRNVTISGPAGEIAVSKGTVIKKRAVYAGFDDFAAHLESVAVETASQ